MATGSFSSHWISYLYLYINALLRRKSHFAVINEKLVPFISWMGIECSRTSGATTCFIAARSLLQLSKCLSVNSSRLYVQNFVLPVFATFPKERSSTRRALSPTKCLTNRGLILYSSIPSRKVFVDEQVISLRTRSLFSLSILRALYIIYFIIHTEAQTYYDMEKWFWRFKIPKQI